ncbi:MAG: UbiA family prenyltransferase, partial [Candidatus Baltobacteraceae bacterium]
ATAADRSIAHGVAEHLGLFDTVIASDGERNLKSSAKLEAISLACGPEFDYIGDSKADVPVWNASRRAIAVSGGRSAARSLVRQGREVETIGVTPVVWRSALRALRPHQWAKNALIFLPLLASHIYTDVGLWERDLLAFVAFSLCASCVYIVNDLLDLESDRRHPRKRRRPFASGELSIPFGIAASLGLLLVSAAIASLSGGAFLATLAIYFALTVSYSLKLKAVVLIDTVVLAGLYTMRVVAGYAATGIVATFWLLAFALFLFFGLAMLKRFSELMDLRKRNQDSTPGRGYRAEDLDIVGIFGAVTGCLAILVLAFYINTEEVTRLYAHPQVLWGIVPVLLYWTSKIWLIAHRGEMHEDPVVYALTDRESLAVFGITACIALAATF